jgi:DNA-dependent RNA polymerase auxiliary subunit epsilon
LCEEDESLIRKLSGKLLDLEEDLDSCNDDLDRWTDSLKELSEIQETFKTSGKFRIRGKKVLDVGTDCVKPLYIALKFKPSKIVGISEELPTFASDLKLSSRLFAETKIGFYVCSLFDEETLSKIRAKEGIRGKFDFVLVSKTLHHLRKGKCVEEHECREDEKCCKYEFKTEIFADLLELGNRVIFCENYFPDEEDKDKVRGRGGYLTTKEWEKILTSISDSKKYNVEFISPIKCHLDDTELKNIISKLRQVDSICFYMEEASKT